MIEKRFVMRYGKYIDTVENIEYDEKWESWKIVELLNTLSEENEELKSFKQRVFDLIDKTIEEETQIAENIEEVAQETRPYAKAVNRITIKTLENLKLELQE